MEERLDLEQLKYECRRIMAHRERRLSLKYPKHWKKSASAKRQIKNIILDKNQYSTRLFRESEKLKKENEKLKKENEKLKKENEKMPSHIDVEDYDVTGVTGINDRLYEMEKRLQREIQVQTYNPYW